MPALALYIDHGKVANNNNNDNNNNNIVFDAEKKA